MITVITPFYNSFSYFRRTFESVVNQSLLDFEWIIVDDYSDASEFEKLCCLASLDARIKLVKNSCAKGAGGARNTGLALCTTDYVTFIDSDDTWEVDFLKVVVDILECGVPAVTCGYNMIDQSSNWVGSFIPGRVVYQSHIARGLDASCLSTAYNLSVCSRRPSFGEAAARNDLYFVHSFLSDGLYILPLPIILANYFVGHASLSSNKFRLIPFMYSFSRYAGYSFFGASFNVLSWMVYGVRKYWARYFVSR